MRAFWSFSGCNCIIVVIFFKKKRNKNPKLVCICCDTNCVTLCCFVFLRDAPESEAARLSVPETPPVGHFIRLCRLCVNPKAMKILHTHTFHSVTVMMQRDHSFLCICVYFIFFSTQPAGHLPKPSASRERPLPVHLQFSQDREAEQAGRWWSGIWYECDYT